MAIVPITSWRNGIGCSRSVAPPPAPLLPPPPREARHASHTPLPCRYVAAGAVVGMGLGGAATFFYLRQQQQRPAARPADAGGFAGAASHPALKHGEGQAGNCDSHQLPGLLHERGVAEGEQLTSACAAARLACGTLPRAAAAPTEPAGAGP